ncbi:MAG: T9SS type A sorting domain-containing protein [Chlorobi bacterium]|nr:T9SS type A sorting domain-containing protein [Chlorobiota bacterium]MCI0716799.1 T9SS type A sorting domain-containing protein [Chlorobiota bacterium]
MKYLVRLIFLIILVTSLKLNLIYAQDTNIVKFIPLKVGNVWVYSGYYNNLWFCSSNFYLRVRIDSSFLSNSKTYFKFSTLTKILSGGNCTYQFFGNSSYRIDSLNGNFYRLESNPNCSYSPNEVIIDSLKSSLRDTLWTCQYHLPQKILYDTNIIQIFGIQKQSKRFGISGLEQGFNNTYTKDIGVVYYAEFGMSLSSEVNLKGCVLNGVVYGDTNFYLVPVNKISTEVTKSYNLHQNYPNPFNPSTQIRFDVPKHSFVKLIVYDALGREISVLVNEQLRQGAYVYEWNAENLPSGVYFYKLVIADNTNNGVSGDYINSKKMVLIK